ncbi:MAG: hypothetical protein Q9175_005391 [Cornicularia normoerica]
MDPTGSLTGAFPRIQENAFMGAIFFLLALAIIVAVVRIMLRIHQSQRFDVDDGFLALAVVTLCASAGVLHAAKNLIYVQVRLSLGLITAKTPALLNELLYYHKLEEAASVLLWISIFAVKFAFLFFFRSLIQRVRPLEVWWFVVVGVMVLAACTCIPLGFMVCPDFSSSFLKTCPASVIVQRETVYLDTTVCIDVLTDLLIISIPTALLWRVKIDLRRKIAIGAVLSLSISMIAIAIIRVALAPLPNDVTDSVWIFFWQFVEAAAAIFMVSLTAIRSVFGHKKAERSSRKAPLSQQYVNMETLDKSGSHGYKAEVGDAV